jgi:hypothetical protein
MICERPQGVLGHGVDDTGSDQLGDILDVGAVGSG